MQRLVQGELMDAADAPRDQLDASLRYIRWVNRRLGGWAGLRRSLERWSRRWPRADQGLVTLLDIGAGSADLPLLARRWAAARGHDLRITAVDLHPTTLELARAHIGDEPGIELVQADALRLMDRYDPGAFDYVHAGMFLHHLPQLEVWTVLRIMDRLARRGLIWNDLLRSSLSLAALNLLLIGQSDMVRHDARASVRAAFTKSEVLDAAHRVGLDYTRFHRIMLHRFTLAGERKGAWDR